MTQDKAMAKKEAAPAATGPKHMPRLLTKYRDVVVPSLREKHGIANIMAVPRLKKITVNMGIGEGTQNKKLPETLAVDLGVICGQTPHGDAARHEHVAVPGKADLGGGAPHP
jgi:hypothetical protein